MGYTRRATSTAKLGDGTFGFWDGTADYLVGGWLSSDSPQTNKTFWKSENGGVTFTQQSDFDYRFHTAATCVVDDVAYIVGGDTLNVTYDGDWRRSSHKFESGVWSQIAANPGIENRCLGALVYLNGSFYYIGGQSSITTSIEYYHTVLRSDDGLTTFTEIQSDLLSQGFRTNLAWGGFVTYRGKIWRIGGGVSGEPKHETSIFSSTDGITWTYRGNFRGLGRYYHQCVVHNGKIWVFNGKNEAFTGYQPSANSDDVWTIEEMNGGKIIQTYKGTTAWARRHAQAMWVSPAGINCFCGSVGTADMWTYQE